MIKELIIKDVRCFAGEQRINIRPLTFLVGENSTGKSTALGCFHVLANIHKFSSNGGGLADFNQEPYRMGSFHDIARRYESSSEVKFSLGWKLEAENTPLEVLFEFEEYNSEPSLSVITILFSQGGKIVIKVDRTGNQKNQPRMGPVIGLDVEDADEGMIEIKISLEESFFTLRNLIFYLHILLENEQPDTNSNILRKFLLEKFSISDKPKYLDKYIRQLFPDMPKVVSIAPIRSKPQRTYDPLSEIQTPEGSDVPMFLMRLKRTGDKREKQILKALADFGKQSGLFDAVDVKPYGKGMNEPFQLQVKVRNVNANILDVGYGVSQLLPILVRIFTALSPTYFLLQQPEVHLHPRGQAELASLFITSISKHERKFIIETHSDYMVKRARIEIRNKRISPDDVSLVYFEPEGSQINVHNIEFDEAGNLLNTPDSYQQFFLDESDRFLGFKD